MQGRGIFVCICICVARWSHLEAGVGPLAAEAAHEDEGEAQRHADGAGEVPGLAPPVPTAEHRVVGTVCLDVGGGLEDANFGLN